MAKYINIIQTWVEYRLMTIVYLSMGGIKHADAAKTINARAHRTRSVAVGKQYICNTQYCSSTVEHVTVCHRGSGVLKKNEWWG